MKTTSQGQLSILGHEAIVLSAYKDAAGVWTIGAGITAGAGLGAIYQGMIITLEKAVEQFGTALGKYEARVEKACPKLPSHQNDALVSFDYNTGQIIKGTVDDKIRAGNFQAAMATLKQYNKAKGKVLPGLTRRRLEEATLFETGKYPQLTGIPVYDKYPGKVRTVSLEAFRASRAAEAPTLPVITADLETAKIEPPAVDLAWVKEVPGPQGRPNAGGPGFWRTIWNWFR